MTSPTKPVRIGVIAASKIATKALIDPAKAVDGVELVAVGARDLERAKSAAAQWEIPRAYGSYDELLADEQVDAVYIATPASLHRKWTIAALDAGKHVLVEKPLAANADEAEMIRSAADAASGLVCMEAFHWRYHPFNQRWIDMIGSGQVGTVRRLESRFNLPVTAIPQGNIRWDLAIGGGATMDLGCYCIQWARAAADATGRFDPTKAPDVLAALAVIPVQQVDGRLTATLRWGTGDDALHALVESSMVESAEDALIDLRVIGTEGELMVRNPLTPYTDGKITVTGSDRNVRETVVVDDVSGGRESTYYYQLVAFRDAVRAGGEVLTTIESGVVNMAIIDDCYRAAGLLPRPTYDE